MGSSIQRNRNFDLECRESKSDWSLSFVFIKKKRQRLLRALRESKKLMWAYRYTLALGMALMLINRSVGLVLPASSKYFIDEVIAKHRTDLLTKIALVVGLASL